MWRIAAGANTPRRLPDELDGSSRISMSQPNPENVSKVAGAFAQSGGMLLTAGTQGNRPQQTFPGIVCSAFSLELYLKCLILLEGNKYTGTHKLDKLFQKLSQDSQTAIRNGCTPLLQMQNIWNGVPRPPSSPPLPVLDFDYALQASRNAFDVFRYVYETEKLDGGNWFGQPIIQCTKERIIALRPEWKDLELRKDPETPTP